MNGHWVSQTRKLNHHYQSAAPNILRTYLLIDDDQRDVNYRFTANGLVISGVNSTRQFVRMSDVSLTDDYIPVMVLYQFGISADGIGFKVLDLVNETFVSSINIDVIMRRETITLESKIDGSELEVDVLVFLVNRAEFGIYTDPGGVLYFDSTPFSGLTFRFPGIDTKIFEVNRKFELTVSGEFYYQPNCDNTYYYPDQNMIVTPKNLNSLKKGSYRFMRSYKVLQTEWERTYPRSYNDTYYGQKYYMMGDYPFTSVSPNMYNGRLGNYCIFLNAYNTFISYSNKNGNVYTQCYLVPSNPILKDYDPYTFAVPQQLSPDSYSLHGRFFTESNGLDNTFRGLFSKASGTDWEIDMTNPNRINGLTDYILMPSYGNPDDGSGSSMSVQSFNDAWENNFNSNA